MVRFPFDGALRWGTMTSSRQLYLGYCFFLVVAYLCLLCYQLLTPAPILMYLFMAFHAIAFVYGWRSWVAQRRADKCDDAIQPPDPEQISASSADGSGAAST